MKTKKYRNKFEAEAGKVLKTFCSYEVKQIPYTIHRTYIPDFVGKNGETEIIILAKGCFRVVDVQKYKAIRDSLKKSQKLIFLLYNPNKKLRKGSKMTMSEWCEKEEIEWYVLGDIANAFDS